MSDSSLLRERLESVLEALERIPRRFADIRSADDFSRNEEGQDRLDAICMILIAVGEAFKQIDRKTEGKLLAHYPEVEWMPPLAPQLRRKVKEWRDSGCLRELITGERLPCMVPSGYRGERGEVWLARVLPPPAPSFTAMRERVLAGGARGRRGRA